jgi:hypothetical protein
MEPKKTLLRSIIFYMVLILMAAVVLEAGAYLVQRFFLVPKGVVYTPPTVDGYTQYLEKRDPVMGWPIPASFGIRDRDLSGSRIVPAFPDHRQKACITLYGDSYTWAKEVADADAWGNQLAKMLNCRVANLGVGAYGTDQAYLRFKNRHRGRSKIVILGHLSENIVRNVIQFFNLLYGGDDYGFKPRFVLDQSGALELIPLPALTVAEFGLMVKKPQRFLKYDYLSTGGLSGAYPAKFPYTLTALKAYNHLRVRAKLARKPFWADFYQAHHPSKALSITAGIIKAFHKDVLAQNGVPVIVVFPMLADIIVYKKTGTWVYRPLLDDLRKAGIEALNMGTVFVNHLGTKNPCDLFTNCENGHYNEKGNLVVAEAVRDYLRKENISVSLK